MTKADELYGLPLERFTAERNALAKGLRREGHRAEAERVVAMRKPSQAAWAVNQLVRTQTRAMASLFDAGDALRAAQSELLAGRGDPSALRKASERERAAVDGLVQIAGGLLSSEGQELTPAMLARVSDTLNAAALDDQAREEVREGCLQRELRHIGLGGAEVADEPSAGRGGERRGATRAAVPAPKRERDEQPAKRELAERWKAERDLAERRKAARRAEADARRQAERAARELARAQERRDRAADLLSRAELALDQAREHAHQAAEAERKAGEALDAP